MKKQVLWINHFLPFPPRGGLLIRTNSLITEVAKAHNVTLLCVVQPRLIAPYFDSVEKGIARIKQECRERGITLELFSLPAEKSGYSRYVTAFKSVFSSEPYSVKWLKSEKFSKKVNSELRSNKYDFVHIDTMGLLGNIDTTLLPSNTVVNHHNAEHTMMARRSVKEQNLLKRINYALEAKKIERYDATKMHHLKHHITCSVDDATAIAQLESNISTSVVPNGVTVKKDVQRTPKNGRFLFVGGLDWYPNTDAIIFLLREVAPLLSAYSDKIQIDIVGKNPNSEITSLVEKFEFISLHGYVEDIEAMYANAQAFICPLRDGGGTKLKVLDAMMHGLPVIGTEIAFEGIDITDQKEGFICEKPSLIAKTLIDMATATNTSEYESVGDRARTLVSEKYDAVAIAQAYSQRISKS